MVSDTRKEKLFFDIIKSQNITYQRKGASLMNISISQNFKNVLKNKIKILISPILYKSIDFIVDNLFEINNPDKYFYFMNTIQSSVKELIKILLLQPLKNLIITLKIQIIEHLDILLINLMFLELLLLLLVKLLFLEHTILINSLVINFSMLTIALIYLNMTTMIQL